MSGFERLAGLSWRLSTLPCGILSHNQDVPTENSTSKWAIGGGRVEQVQMHLQEKVSSTLHFRCLHRLERSPRYTPVRGVRRTYMPDGAVG